MSSLYWYSTCKWSGYSASHTSSHNCLFWITSTLMSPVVLWRIYISIIFFRLFFDCAKSSPPVDHTVSASILAILWDIFSPGVIFISLQLHLLFLIYAPRAFHISPLWALSFFAAFSTIWMCRGRRLHAPQEVYSSFPFSMDFLDYFSTIHTLLVPESITLSP